MQLTAAGSGKEKDEEARGEERVREKSRVKGKRRVREWGGGNRWKGRLLDQHAWNTQT